MSRHTQCDYRKRVSDALNGHRRLLKHYQNRKFLQSVSRLLNIYLFKNHRKIRSDPSEKQSLSVFMIFKSQGEKRFPASFRKINRRFGHNGILTEARKTPVFLMPVLLTLKRGAAQKN